MPSSLRQSTSVDDLSSTTPAPVRRTSSTSSTNSLKRKMTITQTYFLAHQARGKLASQAARSDHDLRLLVGHANLLDSLTADLQQAEREQDAWFEATVAQARIPSEPKRVQWRDQPSVSVRDLDIPDGEDDDSDTDSDASSEDDEDDQVVYAEANGVTMSVAPRRPTSPPPTIMDADSEDDEHEDEDMYDDDEMDNADLSLTRVSSRPSWASISPPPPPELVHDHSDSSDEEEESEADEEELSPAAPSLPIQPVIAPKDFAPPSQQAHGFLKQRQLAVAAC